MIDLPGFNDAAHNWETFESNTFFSLFTTDAEITKYGFHLQLTCQKPILTKEMFNFKCWAIQKHLLSFAKRKSFWRTSFHMMEICLNHSLWQSNFVNMTMTFFFTFRLWLDKHWYKTTTVSGDECLFWNDIFEEWPKAEINEFGVRTMEFLPNFQPFNETSKVDNDWFSGYLGFPGIPFSIQNLTYITWQDNRFAY